MCGLATVAILPALVAPGVAVSSTLGSLQLQCGQVGLHSQSSRFTSAPQHLGEQCVSFSDSLISVSYTHLRAHET